MTATAPMHNEAFVVELQQFEGPLDLLLTLIRDDFSCALVVIEHDMRLIMRLCERIQVLDYGKSIAVGSPEEIRTNKAVIAAYLGEKGAQDAAAN